MLKQNLQFKLSQKLSPQQIQLMKLIQLPTQAFEQRLKEELVENPALESGKKRKNCMKKTSLTTTMSMMIMKEAIILVLKTSTLTNI
jgi:DNA-directed RNA polymerase specialized sigma54-like protein